MSRSRPALIALVAVAVEALIVGVLGNPSVSESFVRHAAKAGSTAQDTLLALTTLAWPTSRGELSTVEYVGAYVAIGVLLVLTYVLVYVLTRGAPTAGQVWLSTWLAVLAATVVAVIVRGGFGPSTSDREGPDRVLYGTLTEGNVLYGIAMGLLAGVFAALIHLATRRQVDLPPGPREFADPRVPAAASPYGYRPVAPAPGGDDQQTEWLPAGPDARPPASSTEPLPPPAPGPEVDKPTTQLPSRSPVWASETSQIPAVPAPEEQEWNRER
jgi:hypothetical protein